MSSSKADSGQANPATAELRDVPSPPVKSASVSFTGPPVSPKARIAFYSADEWEEFVYEWVHMLKTRYVQIKRFGGAGDRGADIAAFKTERGLEGAWDCYQCKHYAKSLALGDAAAEILKVMLAVLDSEYVMPDSYQFLAPNGCSTPFAKLLSQPDKLKAAFLDKLEVGKPLAAGLSAGRVNDARALATTTDFVIFKSAELTDVLEVHRTSPWHSARFATALTSRPRHDSPPVDIETHETRYVDQLLAVYREKHPEVIFSADTVASDNAVGIHFRRQRENFYKAESLRVYARDSVPPGTFDKLQDDIHAGVVETSEADHVSGFERLSTVLVLVGQLDLNRHTLIAVTEIDDRKGICHQLANADRVSWMPQT
ncbi:ABC-three component system protein [Rhodococcoides fascians]|uniref:ABC-three component system protein n=1 Tax=Rhodococcoides fascians TaxID=1828 RepID=UPI00050CB988|nr:ABC-three component system protein [Rhodococcus fascians]